MSANRDRNLVAEQFRNHKIAYLQLDPFGVCNGRCWFCPVRYRGNPSIGKAIMSPTLLEKVLGNIIEEREKADGLVVKNFGGFYTSHYNEVLLYRHFDRLLELCRRYRLCFLVLSNGLPLTRERVDQIHEYRDVVNGICLNIPAFEAEVWAKRSGIGIKHFDPLVANVSYAMMRLSDMVSNKQFSIQVNGVTEHSFGDRGGWLEKGEDFPADMDLDPDDGELATQERIAKILFPGANTYTMPSLIDRAGLLSHVMSNKKAIVRNLMNGDPSRPVIGCGQDIEIGGRPIGWLHVNSAGDAFLCCNDFDFEFRIGNFLNHKLREFWGSETHVERIEAAYNTICRGCVSAIYG